MLKQQLVKSYFENTKQTGEGKNTLSDFWKNVEINSIEIPPSNLDSLLLPSLLSAKNLSSNIYWFIWDNTLSQSKLWKLL